MSENDDIEVKVLQKVYEESRVSSTHILRGAYVLKKIIQEEEGFHNSKGEYVVELNGNRIALIYEVKQNPKNGKKMLGIKKARYVKGKPKARKMVDR